MSLTPMVGTLLLWCSNAHRRYSEKEGKVFPSGQIQKLIQVKSRNREELPLCILQVTNLSVDLLSHYGIFRATVVGHISCLCTAMNSTSEVKFNISHNPGVAYILSSTFHIILSCMNMYNYVQPTQHYMPHWLHVYQFMYNLISTKKAHHCQHLTPVSVAFGCWEYCYMYPLPTGYKTRLLGFRGGGGGGWMGTTRVKSI